MSELAENKYYKFLKRLYYILTVVHVIFVLVTFLLLIGENFEPEYVGFKWLKFLVPLFIAAGLYEADVFYRKGLKRAETTTDINMKMIHYRIAFMLRYLFWLAPSLFAVAAGVLTGKIVYLAFSALIIAVSLSNRPSVRKTKKKLGI
ncbi:MAG: hypothetical protein R6U04_08305 [Bacteroidales bacterium]